MNNKRAQQDLRRLSRNFEVDVPNEANLNEFVVQFRGPEDTAYYGGLWRVNVCLPPNYPFKSPSIGFHNRIYHPNVDEMSGSICMDVINQTWTPMFDLINVFEVFLPQLLLYPNPSSPLNGEAANMLIHTERKYERKVQEMVQKYARDPDFVASPQWSQAMEVEMEGATDARAALSSSSRPAPAPASAPAPEEVVFSRGLDMAKGGSQSDDSPLSDSSVGRTTTDSLPESEQSLVRETYADGSIGTSPVPSIVGLDALPLMHVTSLDDDLSQGDLDFWERLSDVSDMSTDKAF